MHIPDWLYARAQSSGSRLALIAGDIRWTFADLDREVAAASQSLSTAGVREGDLVAVLLRNGAPYVVLIHALARLGAVIVPLNIRLTVEEAAWQVRDAQPRALLFDTSTTELAKDISTFHTALLLLPVDAMLTPNSQGDSLSTNLPPRHIDLNAVQCVMYTSGTTGRPKGAMLTYGNLWWSAVGSALNLGLHSDDRWLACLPLFHVGGLSIVIRGVIYGMACVVHERFDAAAANRSIEEDRVTLVSVVSVMLQRMLDERDRQPYPPHLRVILLGGGPAPRPLLEACADMAVPVVQTYGLTETASQVVTLASEDALRKLGSAGKPLLPVEVRLEHDGHPVTPGEVGEVLVRGPMVTIGYLGRPDETASVLDSGWLYTGDLARLDEEGYLYILDRRSDLIISGGENIYPAEIEAVLLSHPAVREAGVTGMADQQWGQVVVATVVLFPGTVATEEELLAFCRQRLARYKLPRRVNFSTTLPRTAAGKILRRQLRERTD